MLKKLVEKVKHSKKAQKVVAIAMCMSLVFAVCAVNADEGGTTSGVPNLTPITNALTQAFTIDTIIAIIASVIGYSMPFFLMWFAYRFLKRAYVKAVTAGRL